MIGLFSPPLLLATVGEQFHGNPEAIAKRLAQPVIFDIERECAIRYPQRKATGQPVIESTARQFVAAFLRVAACTGDQSAKRGITFVVLRKHNEPAPALQFQLGTNDQFFQAMLLRRRMRTYDTRHRTFVGDRERFITETRSSDNEFLGAGRAAQEREITDRMQLGIAA